MKKIFLAVLLCAALIIVFMPSAALADTVVGGTLNIIGGTYSTDFDYDSASNSLIIKTGRTLTLSGTTDVHVTIQTLPGVAANIILNGLNVTVSTGPAFNVNGRTVNLTIQDGSTNSLTSGVNNAGLACGTGSTLVINGSGSLSATGGIGGAGIGGSNGSNGGTITISDATVIAIAGKDPVYSTDGAGIGGGAYGSSGKITINSGNVIATGGNGGAGIGGGTLGGLMDSITINGGSVFASGGGKDIGIGWMGSGGNRLYLNDTAAVFLKNNSCDAIIITSTHTNESITGHSAGDSVYGIPNIPWNSPYGAYLALRTLTYDTNGGSGTAPASVTQHIGTITTVAAPGSYTKAGFTQGSGWNTASNGGGTNMGAGDVFTFNSNTTLYTKWTQNAAPTPTPTTTPVTATGNGLVAPGRMGLPDTLTLHVGGRTQLTPSPDGGLWTVDPQYLSSHHSVFTVTALKPGKTVIRYTVGWEDTEIPVTILPSSMPQTGQDFTLIYVLIAVAACVITSAIIIARFRKSQKN